MGIFEEEKRGVFAVPTRTDRFISKLLLDLNYSETPIIPLLLLLGKLLVISASLNQTTDRQADSVLLRATYEYKVRHQVNFEFVQNLFGSIEVCGPDSHGFPEVRIAHRNMSYFSHFGSLIPQA